jgi:hypothetical protein
MLFWDFFIKWGIFLHDENEWVKKVRVEMIIRPDTSRLGVRVAKCYSKNEKIKWIKNILMFQDAFDVRSKAVLLPISCPRSADTNLAMLWSMQCRINYCDFIVRAVRNTVLWFPRPCGEEHISVISSSARCRTHFCDFLVRTVRNTFLWFPCPRGAEHISAIPLSAPCGSQFFHF